ncbi:MAG TPA: DUF3046 domain-containing protein [Mycobacteriales bacterium]|nr:DUF3046 domain-containing protein [Mycobacteriales bacterium]
MRLSDFWARMQAQFGPAYVSSIARDQVIGGLGGRSVEQALADGEEPKEVWLAVCEHFEVPLARRH